MIKKHNNIKNKILYNGGKGSGNWGHKGRPGKIGGSGKGGNDPERVKYRARLGSLARQVKARNNKIELLRKIKNIKTNKKNFKKTTAKNLQKLSAKDKEMYNNLNVKFEDIGYDRISLSRMNAKYIKNNIEYFNKKIKDFSLEKNFYGTDLEEIKQIVEKNKKQNTRLIISYDKRITKLNDNEFKEKFNNGELNIFQRAWTVPDQNKLSEYEKQFNEGNRTFVGKGFYGGGFYFSANLNKQNLNKEPNNTSKSYGDFDYYGNKPYSTVAYVGIPKDFKLTTEEVLLEIIDYIDSSLTNKIDNNISLLAQILGFDGIFCTISENETWVNVLNMGKLYQYGELQNYKRKGNKLELIEN